MMIKNAAILIVLSVFTHNVNAQKITPGYTFNVELALPGAIANAPFGDIMQGLASGALYGQYSFPFHLHVGAGIKYSLFTINEFAIPEQRDGNMQVGAAFLKVGWDKFHNDRFGTDFGVKLGYAENMFSTKNPNVVQEISEPLFKRISSTNIETTLGLILTADERNSYRLVLGHGVSGYGFKPEYIGLKSNEGYDVASFNKLTHYFIIGFGYTYYFGQKSSTD